MTGSRYEARPWLDLLDDAQRAPIDPADSLVHALRRVMGEAPDRTFLAYFDGRLTYRDVDELTDSVAGHLAARGLERGDRVAILLIARCGYGAVPAWRRKRRGNRRAGQPFLGSERDQVLLHRHVPNGLGRTGPPLSHRGRRRVSRTRSVPGGRIPSRPGLGACSEAAERPRTISLVERGPRTLATHLAPQVALSNLCTPHRPQACISDCSPERVMPSAWFRGFRHQRWPPDVIPGACQFGACLNSAGTLVLAYRFEAGVVLDAFAAHRPHYTVGPSTAFMAPAAHPSVTPDHFSSFRIISSGGAPLPPALVEKFRAGFGPYIRNGYGLTECTAPCASVPPGREAPVDPASGTLAVGVPGPDTVVRIVDDQGAEMPFGEQGEIVVRGPQVVPGYWRRPDATAETFPDGELRTGDIGFMDAEGWLYVVDRKKDMINASAGGLGVSPRKRSKVWPREVEDVLYTHPAVREAAVVGVPDGYRGETVKAYISLRPGADPDPDALAAYCKERLAAYKYPRQVEILPDLPKTASGKILRRELRSRSHESQ
ncbi:class I adenylate-forming enzyme family protein [Streptomyces sp. PSKA30]|uniref:class I adenylate-forming enzyme family protein n=1 Tax=Streptomyces sp. PSKA30 TaxID=2874597 RepID=UPI001CD11FA5|nr:AMP-binding protein [Streptomyces sp. PSKA30]MBZ9639107.1 AMP-binding protein [Streptomyces sp. PSKA30]